MPLTKKGEEIMGAMKDQYGEEEGKKVFYASRNKGTITGVDPASSNGSINTTKKQKAKAANETVKNPGRSGMYARYAEMKKERPK